MHQKRNRLRALAAMVGLAASMFLVQAAVPTAAHARCNGVNTPVTDTLVVRGVTYVTAVPVTNTCNNNDYYQSDFHSNVAGWRASIWIQNNGLWTGYYGPYSTAWITMGYTDNNSNSLIMLCADDGTYWMCGYGSTSVNSTGGPTFLINESNQGF